jgi:hypothetical protein
VIRCSILLLSAEFRLISNNFGCHEAKIQKQPPNARIQTRPKNCPKRCTYDIETLRHTSGTTASTDALGKVCFWDFSAADLRNPNSDILYCICARDRSATPLGW